MPTLCLVPVALYATKGVDDLAASRDAALAVNEYDSAIELYLAVIDLNATNEYDRAIELYSAAIDLDLQAEMLPLP